MFLFFLLEDGTKRPVLPGPVKHEPKPAKLSVKNERPLKREREDEQERFPKTQSNPRLSELLVTGSINLRTPVSGFFFSGGGRSCVTHNFEAAAD